MSRGLRPLSDFQDPRMEYVNDVDFESILQIAVLCTATSSTGRPTIDLVFNEMELAWINTQIDIVSLYIYNTLFVSSDYVSFY